MIKKDVIGSLNKIDNSLLGISEICDNLNIKYSDFKNLVDTDSEKYDPEISTAFLNWKKRVEDRLVKLGENNLNNPNFNFEQWKTLVVNRCHWKEIKIADKTYFINGDLNFNEKVTGDLNIAKIVYGDVSISGDFNGDLKLSQVSGNANLNQTQKVYYLGFYSWLKRLLKSK